MPGSGRQQHRIALADLEFLARNPAEADHGFARGNAKDFIGIGVIMREGIDAVAPAIAPAVPGEEVLEFGCGIPFAARERPLIDDHRPMRVIGHIAIIGKPESFDLHGKTSVRDLRTKCTLTESVWLYGGG